MKKTLMRIAAVLLIAVLGLGIVGCHKPGEIAVTVDGEEFTSGFYACVFLAADNEAQNLIYQQAAKQNITITSKNLYTQKIDGVVYEEWVKAKVAENFKKLIAAKKLCEKNVVKTAEYLDNAKANAKTEWQANKEYFEKNGIGLQSYQNFSAYQVYSTAYFDYLYGKDGPEEVKEDEINKFIKENYVYLNVIDSNITSMTEQQKKDEEKKLKGYADRLNKGESFTKIYAEVSGTKYAEDKTDEGIFSHTLAAVVGSEKTTNYESPMFKSVKDLKKGDVKVLTTDPIEGSTYMFVARIVDIDRKSVV